ncbi:MAG: fluoride efflux transporter CrcB [Chlorobi bacterium]|nr:fluoride efflux transporter CrcB [Chlorobiota bacterium]
MKPYVIKFFIVFFGAGFGGSFRYVISAAANRLFGGYFPLGTLSVNIIGSFLLGLLIFGLDAKSLLGNEMKLFLAIGFCGGFTTFSTFSFETIMLIRHTEYFIAGMNIILNLFLTLFALYLAYIITK